MNEKEIQQMLDDLKLARIQALLRLLALNFTNNTKIQEVQRGQRAVVCPLPPRSMDLRFTPTKAYITVPIEDFFGAHIGYSAELDTLFVWFDKETKK